MSQLDMPVLDLALEVLSGCERFGPAVRASLARRAPDLSLRFDHYAVRRHVHACPGLADAATREAYVDRFVPAALERVAALANDLKGAGLQPREALPEPAAARLAQAPEGAGQDADHVESVFDGAVALLAETIAGNLLATPNRAMPVALPDAAVALVITLDADVQRGWADGNLRLLLSPPKGATQTVTLSATPDVPRPYSCEALPPDPLTGRPRLRLSWPAGSRPKAVRLQQHGGWPSPQAQLRLEALDGSGRGIADLNPVKTALDLLGWLGRLSCEDRRPSGRNVPVYCVGWHYLVTNDFAAYRTVQRALGYANSRFDDLLAAVSVHNRHLPPALQRVVGRQNFAKPLPGDGLGEVACQMAALEAILRAELGLTPFLAHASLMGCIEGGAFFAEEDRASLAVVVAAEDQAALGRFAAEAAHQLASRIRMTKTVRAGALAGLTCSVLEAARPVPIELLVFRRDPSGHVFGVGEGAREIPFEADWFGDLDEAELHGLPFRVPRRRKGFLADIAGSRWSLQGQWYGALSSVRPQVEACLTQRRAHAAPEAGRLRLVGLRDLARDPDVEVVPLAEGRPYVRPAADLVADLSGLAYRHDLAAPLRLPLPPVALVRAPPDTIVRGSILLELPGGRLFLPKHARYDGARNFAEAIFERPDSPELAHRFFSGLDRDPDGRLTLAEMPVCDLPGDVLWATPDEWDNWGVWLVQTLPAIVQAENAGFDGTLLCRAATGWQHRFLEIFAPRLAGRLVVQEFDRAYRIGGRVHTVAQETRTMALTDFARAIYGEVVERALRAVPDEGGAERLFISRLTHSRANPHYRALANEPDLIEALSEHGFRAVEPEKLDVLSQIALFARAREIVGLGGAGMFNLAFAREGTSVLDIESSTGWVASHTNLFATARLRFGVIFGRPDDGAGAHARWSLPLDEATPLVRDFFGLR